MTAYLVFALAGIGTYLARSLFILVAGDRRLPQPIERGLRNIGPAVLAALAASLLTSNGVVDYVTNLAEVTATVVGIAVAWKTRRFVVSFVAAMAVLWIIQALS